MPETTSQLVADIREEGSFDCTEAQALRWLNRRHRQMCAIAECFRKRYVVPSGTVADQAEYTWPADLIRPLEVAVGGQVYEKAVHTDIRGVANGTVLVTGPGLLFAETASTAGVKQVSLIPAPSVAGDAIVIYGAFRPLTLLMDNSVPLQIDDEAEEALLAGVYSTALARPNEARADLAASHEAIFQAGAQELRMRTKHRFQTPGPAQIRLVG